MVSEVGSLADTFTKAEGGDSEAESRLLAEYAPRLRFLIRRRVGRPDDVEDVLQEVMTGLVEAIQPPARARGPK